MKNTTKKQKKKEQINLPKVMETATSWTVYYNGKLLGYTDEWD